MTPLLCAGHSCTYKGITQGGPSLGSGKAAAIGTCGGHPTTPVYEAGLAQEPGLGGRHECLVQQWRHSGFWNKAEWCAQGSSAPEAEQTLGTSLPAEYSNDLEFPSCFPPSCCQG